MNLSDDFPYQRTIETAHRLVPTMLVFGNRPVRADINPNASLQHPFSTSTFEYMQRNPDARIFCAGLNARNELTMFALINNGHTILGIRPNIARALLQPSIPGHRIPMPRVYIPPMVA